MMVRVVCVVSVTKVGAREIEKGWIGCDERDVAYPAS